MQPAIRFRFTPKAEREMQQWKGGTLGNFGVSERIGSGASRSRLSRVEPSEAIKYLNQRALEWVDKGYAVEWHDEQRWFVATCEDQPTVYCVLQEASHV